MMFVSLPFLGFSSLLTGRALVRGYFFAHSSWGAGIETTNSLLRQNPVLPGALGGYKRTLRAGILSAWNIRGARTRWRPQNGQ